MIDKCKGALRAPFLLVTRIPLIPHSYPYGLIRTQFISNNLYAMIKIKDIDKVLIMKLQGLYDMENEIMQALPEIEKAAANPKIKQGLVAHLEETEGQIARIEEIFEILEEEPEAMEHQAIRGIIEDGIMVTSMDIDPIIKDSLLTGAIRQVEHYEMAIYMCVVGLAEAAGKEEICELLMLNLSEEIAADEKLRMISQESLGKLDE